VKKLTEEEARLAKVLALIAQLERNMAFVGIPLASSQGLDVVRKLTPADWKATAREAKVKPPSKRAIALVIEAIEARGPRLRKTTPVPGQLALLREKAS
jgi:hypothetical protein